MQMTKNHDDITTLKNKKKEGIKYIMNSRQ